VIQLRIDPAANLRFNLSEIFHHPQPIQCGGRQFNFHGAVVAVQVTALARIVEQPMAVAELQHFGHAVHYAINRPPST
jgi:hypothetical protein